MAALYDTKRTQKRRAATRLIGFMFFLISVGASAGFAYEVGRRLAVAELETRDQRIGELEAANATLIEELARAERNALRVITERDTLQQRYDADVPPEQDRALIELIRERRSAGIGNERLSTVIANITNGQSCDQREVKRFRPSTRLTPQGESAISFEDGSVSVTGSGIPDRDEENNPVAWFDPDEDVEIAINLLDGRQEAVTGTLPLNTVIVSGAREYRLSFTNGPRSFVIATFQGCAFP